MDKVFGIPMNGIMVTFVILLVLCLLTVAWVALRKPVVFKMGMRNIPRRKAQTTLILVGLMLSTLISTAALGMGDTIDRSLTASIYDVIGNIDELVVSSPEMDANVSNALTAKMPADTLNLVEETLKDNPDVDGVMPALLEQVPAIDGRSNLSTPQVFLIGIDPARLEAFGGLHAKNGDSIDLAGLGPNEVVISESSEDELDAQIGDQVTIFYQGQPFQLTVKEIAKNSALSGVLDSSENPGMVMPLDRLQTMTDQQGLLSFIGISNRGDKRSGIGLTDTVTDTLEPALAGKGLGVDKIKQSAVDQTELASSGLTGLFLVLGLFSIAVGILLIILIFSMLAAERRPEMGMARAVGQQRGQLIQQFIAEGAGYALLSGIVGAAAGVVVTYILALIFAGVVGDFFKVEAYVSPRSMVVGYCLGVIITFLAIVVSSFRASRLNIVAAVRDIPDVSNPTRRRRTLVTATIMIVLGAFFAFVGQAGSSARAFFFYGGMSLIPFGLAILAQYFGVKARPVFSIVGIYILILWLLPGDVSRKLFGDLGGDFEMFFLSGVFMVAGATVLIAQNLDTLLGLVSRMGGIFKSKLPAVRMAIAYPGATHGRTGLTVAMFSLIVFSLVCFATISENFSNLFLSDKADAGWDVQVQVPYTNQLPNKDLVSALNNVGVDTSDITAVSWLDQSAPAAGIRQVGIADQEYDTITLTGMDDTFIKESDLGFQARADGYDSDQAIIDALMTQPNVAVADSTILSGDGGFGDTSSFQVEGIDSNAKTFAPIQVEILNPETGKPAQLTIIGIIDSDISTLLGLYANHTFTDQVYPRPAATYYDVKLSEPDKSKQRAETYEKSLINNGAQSESFKEILDEQQAQFQGFLYLIQGFMGLGLVVGIAAVGVIAFRAVVERRQQIGMLRALGFQKAIVSLSFMIETAFVVGLGVISGTILALALAYNLFSDPEFTGQDDTSFIVPWVLVAVILAIAFGMALLMTWIPSRQAASIAPAEALRYE